MFLLPFLACLPSESAPEELTVEVTPTGISTVLDLHWTTEEPGLAWVEYGLTTDLGRRTPAETEARTEHAIRLAGLGAGETWQFRAFTRTSSGLQQSTVLKWTTEEAPEGSARYLMPTTPSEEDGFFLCATDGAGPIIADRAGRVVWWVGAGHADTLQSSARWRNDRIWWQAFRRDADESEDKIYSINLDLSDPMEYPVPGIHHDFEVLDDRLAMLVRDKRQGPDGTQWIGDSIVERMFSGGEDRVVWDSWDSIPLERPPKATAFYDDGVDWMHCNSVSWSPENQVYVTSCRQQEAIYAVERSSRIRWVMSENDQATLRLTRGHRLGYAHRSVLRGNLLWVYSNNSPDVEGSEGAVYQVDEGAGRYKQVWAWSDGETVPIHGNVEPTDGGHVLVVGGLSGGVSEVDPAGNVRWSAEGRAVGYCQYLATLGGPL